MFEARVLRMQDAEDVRARKMAQGIVEEIESCGGNMSLMWSVLGNLISYSRQMAEVGTVHLEYVDDLQPDAMAEVVNAMR